jgi:hypothetical protein
MDYLSAFESALEKVRSEGRYRVFADLKRHRGNFPRATWTRDDGSESDVVVWCSNDYLGQGQNPVVTEAMKVIEAARLSAQRIERFMTRTMTVIDELEFAERAKEIKALNVTNDELLKVRRPEDDKNDLWTVFNRVQENIMRGGLEGVSAQGRRIRTGGVRSLGSTLRVNTSLWELAEEFA